MKPLATFVNESSLTKEEVRSDYNKVDGLESKKQKLEYANKYGVDSVKKDDIKKAILLKLRELRKSASQFDEEDYRDFVRLTDWTVTKLPEFLDQEPFKFVTWMQEYYLEKYMTKKLRFYIGHNPGNNEWGLSYSDKNTIKFYNKLLTYIADHTPKTKTAKDEIFDLLVGKFTDLLEDYKTEYLKKVGSYAVLKYRSVPGTLDDYKKKMNEEDEKLQKISWRTNREEYREQYNVVYKLRQKVENLEKFLKKYTETTYKEFCINKAKEEFENNIKVLAHKIQDDGLEVDKLEVKSVHDDPKVFNMKITDGTKNLYCRSILAAEFSNYMIPHYRFIITNRSKDDSNYKD